MGEKGSVMKQGNTDNPTEVVCSENLPGRKEMTVKHLLVDCGVRQDFREIVMFQGGRREDWTEYKLISPAGPGGPAGRGLRRCDPSQYWLRWWGLGDSGCQAALVGFSE